MGREKWRLSEHFVNQLSKAPESGMGYQVVTIELQDGRILENVVIVGGQYVKGIYGYKEIPFSIDEIKDVEVTHLRKPKGFDQKKWLYFYEE